MTAANLTAERQLGGVRLDVGFKSGATSVDQVALRAAVLLAVQYVSVWKAGRALSGVLGSGKKAMSGYLRRLGAPRLDERAAPL